MRILHTSDWHLGRSFHREGMLTHQAAYVDHLLEVVESERVDLVVVAGDVYDRALPPVDAVRLADETLARLAHSRARVVVTSGNHDSAQRLGFSARLIDAAGVFIRTDASAVGTPVVLADEHGPVAVYGLPYLDPLALAEPWGLPVRSHEAALAEPPWIGSAGTSPPAPPAPGRSCSRTRSSPADSRASPSATSASAASPGSPRRCFDGVDYAALGHLHGAQTLTRAGPLQRVAARLLLLRGRPDQGFLAGRPRGRRLGGGEFVRRAGPATAGPDPRGTLESLLADPALAEYEQCWVQATLTDDVRPGQAMERLRRRFPHALVLAFEPGDRPERVVPTARPGARSDHDIALDFVRELRGAPATAAESALLQQACDACCDDPDVDTLLSPAGGGR